MRKIRKRRTPLKLGKKTSLIPIALELVETEFLPARPTKKTGRPSLADIRADRAKKELEADKEKAAASVRELFSMSQSEYEQLQRDKDEANRREIAEMMKALKELK